MITHTSYTVLINEPLPPDCAVQAWANEDTAILALGVLIPFLCGVLIGRLGRRESRLVEPTE